jgi:hypothetical protein
MNALKSLDKSGFGFSKKTSIPLDGLFAVKENAF